MQEAEEVAETANRMKDEFLATMSHELRTPLSVIIGYTDLLLEDAFGSLSDAATDILRRVGRNAEELYELITALLDLSRLEAGPESAKVETVHIAELLETVQTETQGLGELAQLEMVWRVDPQLPALATDRGKLKTVLKNLVSNAVKFTDQGRVLVEAGGREGGVEIRVTDTGRGIPEEARVAIFEPFYQVDHSLTHQQGGIGLGLHIVKRLLDGLGGRIEVESEVGRGSTFSLWLPTHQGVNSTNRHLAKINHPL